MVIPQTHQCNGTVSGGSNIEPLCSCVNYHDTVCVEDGIGCYHTSRVLDRPISVEVALRTHRHSTHGRRAVPPRTDITTLCYYNCVVPCRYHVGVVPSDTMSVWLPHIPRMGVQYLHVAALPPPSRIIVSRPHPLHITFHTPTDPDLSWCTSDSASHKSSPISGLASFWENSVNLFHTKVCRF